MSFEEITSIEIHSANDIIDFVKSKVQFTRDYTG